MLHRAIAMKNLRGGGDRAGGLGDVVHGSRTSRSPRLRRDDIDGLDLGGALAFLGDERQARADASA